MQKEKKEEILEKLYSLHRFGIKPGLERTLKLLKSCGEPHNNFPVIHVAGTNGKGSVCSILASILMEGGSKVGLYTSPHIVKFNERIKINGIEISDNELVRLAEMLMNEGEKYEATFFEITTAIAFKYFADNNVDIAVIETGMGGRFDSTNVLTPLLSIITPIDFDHREYLGNTLEEIAFEKAGIIKPNILIVVSENRHVLKQLFHKIAAKNNSEIFFSEDYCRAENISFYKDLSMSVNIQTAFNEYTALELGLAGLHQVNNLKTVITALEVLGINSEENNTELDDDNTLIFSANLNSDRNKFINFPKVSNFRNVRNSTLELSTDIINNKEIISLGLKKIKSNTGLMGRIELLRKEPPLILDVAHNPVAFEILFDTLRRCGYEDTKWNIVYGAMSDKDVVSILKIIKPYCNRLYATVPTIERAMNLNTLVEKAKSVGMINVIPIGRVSEAVGAALSDNAPTLIAGSFYVAGEALHILQ